EPLDGEVVEVARLTLEDAGVLDPAHRVTEDGAGYGHRDDPPGDGQRSGAPTLASRQVAISGPEGVDRVVELGDGGVDDLGDGADPVDAPRHLAAEGERGVEIAAEVEVEEPVERGDPDPLIG